MLPPWRKRRFCRFLHFRRGGNVDFAIFCISAVAETYFLPFSVFPPRRKRRFCRFLHFRRGGNVIFRIFHSAEAADETKTAKFGIDHTTENGKSRPAACWKTIALCSRTMRSVGTDLILFE